MLLQLTAYVQSRFRTEDGATMVEYGIMIALIAVISIGIIATIGTDLLSAFTDVEAELPGATP
jgi:pilus assembly protein Flp/PilA